MCTKVHTMPMFEIIQSQTFAAWISGLRDKRAVAKINTRLRRASLGNLGDVSPVGQGVSEMRIDYGPGYRVYFKKVGRVVLIVLCGGSKKTQAADIKNAIRIAKAFEE